MPPAPPPSRPDRGRKSPPPARPPPYSIPAVDDDAIEDAIDTLVDKAVDAGLVNADDAETVEDNLNTAVVAIGIAYRTVSNLFGSEYPELKSCLVGAIAGWTFEDSLLANATFFAGLIESPSLPPPPPLPAKTTGDESGDRRLSEDACGSELTEAVSSAASCALEVLSVELVDTPVPDVVNCITVAMDASNATLGQQLSIWRALIEDMFFIDPSPSAPPSPPLPAKVCA